MKIPSLSALFILFSLSLLQFAFPQLPPTLMTSSLINATHVYIPAHSHIHKPLSPLSAAGKHMCLEMTACSWITHLGTFTPWRKLILAFSAIVDCLLLFTWDQALMGCSQSMLAFTWNSHHAGLVWATIFLRIQEYNLLGTLTNELSRRLYSEFHLSKLI